MVGARGRAPRGDSAVRYPDVGNREENGEGSAWLARVGAPLSRGEGGPGRRGNPPHQFFPENFAGRACNPL